MKTINKWVNEALERGDSPSEVLTSDLEWIATQVRKEALEEAAHRAFFACGDVRARMAVLELKKNR